MRTFKDDTGREWKVEIKAFQVERLIDDLDLDLGKKEDIDRVFASTKTFLQVLWLLIEKQARELKLTEEDAKTAFGPDALQAAVDAVLGEVHFFTPTNLRAKQDEALTAIRKRRTAIQTEVASRMDGVIEKIGSGELDARLGFRTPPSPNPPASSPSENSSGGSEASPASITAGTPSEA